MNRKKIITYIFPPLCGGCDKEGISLCNKCTKEIVAYQGPVNKYLESGLLDDLIIGFSYCGPVKKIIKLIKYKGALSYGPILTTKLLSTGVCYNIDKENTIITSIPMHRWKKNMIRGYNQAEILGKEISGSLGVNYKEVASKNRWTKAQASLSRAKRKSNLLGSFTIIELIPKNVTHIVVVDDLITTGSTLFSLAKEIKRYYPNIKITGLVFARN